MPIISLQKTFGLLEPKKIRLRPNAGGVTLYKLGSGRWVAVTKKYLGKRNQK